MQKTRPKVLQETLTLQSELLERDVIIDFYLPTDVPDPSSINLLLINDGQDMKKLGLFAMLNEFYGRQLIEPLLCVGIHAGIERKMEYATAKVLDYKGRGAKAQRYTEFIFEELLPLLLKKYNIP